MSMRDEFEKWQIETGRTDPIWFESECFDEINQEYFLDEINRDWQIWQASRESLVIELPGKISQHNTDANGYVNPVAAEYDEAIDDCRDAIHAAGVKTK